MSDPFAGGGGGRFYRVVAPVGRGGFGTVYRAELLGAGGFSKQVALKMLNADVSRASDMARRLRDEARILGLVRHRAIVQVDGLVLLNGAWTVVMEYVDGANLKTCIEHAGAMPPGPALEILGEVAGALYVAYNSPGPDGRPLRLLHRDIKPSNIQITRMGEPKVLDFGIARADFELREANTTSRGFGSWEYMAPERLDGIDGPQGDVYALGALLFECLVGRAFGKASGNPVRHQQRLQEGMSALRKTRAGANLDLVEFIGRMLAYDPEDRPASRLVERECADLRRSMGGETLRDWAERVIPMVEERQDRMPLDAISGTVLEEQALSAADVSDLDAEASLPPGAASTAAERSLDETGPVGGADEPVAPAFGLPRDVTGESPSPDPADDWFDESPSTGSGVSLETLATRDLTPGDTRLGQVWGAISIVLLVLALVGLGFLTRDMLMGGQAPTTTVMVPAPTRTSATARSAVPRSEGEEPTASEEPTAPEEPPEAAPAPQPIATAPDPRPAPRPVPTVAPAPAPDPADPEPVRRRDMGVVKDSGDAKSVELRGPEGTYGMGRVPPGTYTIHATFPGRGTVVAGKVTVASGGRYTLVCNEVFTRCQVQ